MTEPWESGPPKGFDDEPPKSGEAPTPPLWEQFVMPVPAEWYVTPPPPREWLLRDKRRPKLDGLLPLGKVGGFIAAGGVGKTLALLDLARAVATGGDWLRTFACPSSGKVLAVLGEEDAEEAKRRTFNVSRGQDRHPAAGDVVILPFAGVPCAMLEHDEQGNTRETAFLLWLRDYVARTGPWRLILIDPLSRFGGPDVEKDNAAGTRFIQALESLATLSGATVIFSHHTPKNEATARGGRGSSSIFDGARWEAKLDAQSVPIDDPDTRERLGELITWTHTKSNYSLKAQPLQLRRAEGGPLVPLDETDLETVKAKREAAAPAQVANVRQAEATTTKVLADAEKVFKLIDADPGIGSTRLRDRSHLGPTGLGRAVQHLLDTGRIVNRPDTVGRRIDPHYYPSSEEPS